MQQKHIIPISDPKIKNLYYLWLNNGFGKEEKIDIKKALLKGSEKDLHQINLYSIEHNGEILSSVILIFQKDNPYISGLGEVCTKIDVRGKNYASKLCKLARDDFFSIDNSEINFLGTVNPNAARIYKSLGWKKIKNSEVMFNSINFSIENPKVFETKLRQNAIIDAENKANEIAKFAHVLLGSPIYISENSPINFAKQISESDIGITRMAAAPSTEIPSGQLTLSFIVNMGFSIVK